MWPRSVVTRGLMCQNSDPLRLKCANVGNRGWSMSATIGRARAEVCFGKCLPNVKRSPTPRLVVHQRPAGLLVFKGWLIRGIRGVKDRHIVRDLITNMPIRREVCD